ncbi:hypothetical protein [Bradyrhizobium sp. CW1]|nr:hypothetical protein [Bradyrhizobium sp. CW1]UPJ26381.1 hypothetical protein IVB54_32335 [Bradyrhizobium sp. CW1]
MLDEATAVSWLCKRSVEDERLIAALERPTSCATRFVRSLATEQNR